ncbi:rifin [Plasmodium falciparum IGH-CR14]|uniref:Rifin n=1 Tax=Plasmodium falciparum IGH-CR14 TaxID=580059 RepID=A0A0L1IFY8_PLAFA|nr:rifin [Plasmodium falciparum IGH-CR14]
MKVHYINILLFALPLNILVTLCHVNTHKKPSITPHTQTNRLLCECELYTPANYDNDPQMKEVMDNFNRQTQQRFHEYDERMVEKRMQCKDKCDKEIQKIILKDKLEKQMAEQLTTLETKITTDDIPTCVCEKSLADKTEKFCLNCSKNMGAIAPWWGLVCGVGYAGWSHYVPIAVAKAAMDAGMNVVINVLKTLRVEKVTAVIFKEISSINDFSKVTTFADIIQQELKAVCTAMSSSPGDGTVPRNICMIVQNGRAGGVSAEQLVSKALETILDKAPKTAKAAKKIEAAKYTSTTSSLTTGITASIIAIVIIVLIMVIIYLILHYRRKKKMKKKLQYIKLLEE